MFKRSFRNKIIAPAVIVLIILTVVVASCVSVKFRHFSDTLVNEKHVANIQSLKDHINNGKRESKKAAQSMACNPQAINVIKSRDRKKILEFFTPTLELFQINFYTITDEQGIVLAKTHEPDQYGDSALDQQNVRDALKGNVATYFEAGTAVKVSVRTGAPVYDTDGTLVGIISAGMRFDTNEAVDLLKQNFHCDVTIFFGDTKISTTITDKQTGKRILGTKLDPHIAEIVIKGKREYKDDVDIIDTTYKAFYLPLLDAKNEVFAVFFVGTPTSELKKIADALIWDIITISFVGLIVSIVIMYWVISSISKPLLELVDEMNKMEGGKLTLLIDSKSDDEIGYAGKSLKKVADKLHKLIDDINVAISEYERGNTEHRLDTSDFNGAYRLLADRIVDLSGLGMNDQLTGLPNRRSFDNRLTMEWGRAMRERLPLSLLMIDVDKFKIYNDSYGHQQGDVALQTVAKAMTIPIKRGFDFAARWGGEEFAVLLPGTDAKGATYIAEIMRAQIERTSIPCLDGRPAKSATVSIGICTHIPRPTDTLTTFIANADSALYRAKEAGRNMVFQHE